MLIIGLYNKSDEQSIIILIIFAVGVDKGNHILVQFEFLERF
jgi:hypothetical protein